MSHEPRGLLYKLAVNRVLHAALDRDHDGLVSLVADYQTNALLASVADFRAVRRIRLPLLDGGSAGTTWSNIKCRPASIGGPR